MKQTVRRLSAASFPRRGLLDTSEEPQVIDAKLREAFGNVGKADRQTWRELIYAAEGLGEFCSGVILDPEALLQETSGRDRFTDLSDKQVSLWVCVLTAAPFHSMALVKRAPLVWLALRNAAETFTGAVHDWRFGARR